MPTDVRKLIFTKQELRLAFQQFCKDKGMNVPNSPLESFQVVEGGANRVVSDHSPEGMKIILHYTSHDPNNPLRVHLSEDQVLEALISLCKGMGIPLPRRGQKFLQKHKDALALTIGMTENDLRVVHVM
ncbi:MAG TPA: hypothetical protein VIN57_01550 [Magnetovibrio sp.]